MAFVRVASANPRPSAELLVGWQTGTREACRECARQSKLKSICFIRAIH